MLIDALDGLIRPMSLAVDTNIVSYVVSNRNKPIDALFQNKNVTLILSDTVLAELKKGAPNGEMEYLRECGALQIKFSSDIAQNGTVILSGIDDVEVANETAEHIERFLVDVFRLMANTKSEVGLSGSIVNALNVTADWFETEENSTFHSSWIRNASHKIERKNALNGQPKEKPQSDSEQKQNGVGAAVLGNLRPTYIVEKLIVGASDEIKVIINSFFQEHLAGPLSRDKIQLLGLLLSALGYSKDSRIGKERVDQSIKGGISQWNDIKHIASCSGCNLFLTRDRDCARLGYALYEHFGVKTFVGLLVVKEDNVELKLVGTDFWP